MKPTFLEGALVAALTSLVGSMLYHVLYPIYGGDAVGDHDDAPFS